MHLPPFWRQRLLAAVGAPRAPENLRLLDAWQRAEGGQATWNPLNTTLHVELFTTGDFNAIGVKNYSKPTAGVCATALTLIDSRTTSRYGGILGDLQAGKKTAEQIVRDRADQFRAWGTDPDVILACLK